MYVLLSHGDNCMMVPVQLPNTQPLQQTTGHLTTIIPLPPVMPASGVGAISTGGSQFPVPVQLNGAYSNVQPGVPMAITLPPLSEYGLFPSSALQQNQTSSHILSSSSGDPQQHPSITMDSQLNLSSSFNTLQLPPFAVLSQQSSSSLSSTPSRSITPPLSMIASRIASAPPPTSTEDKKQTSDVKKQHQCQECGKFFTRKFNLKQHMRIHLNIKPFVCNMCDKAFTQKHSLKHHLRTHTGIKPFECDFCSKRFAVKYNLTTHRRIHTGEKPYVCNECDSRFTSRSGLTSHIRHNH
eukprot:CAMPEP_0202702606 /NCGR_PEP_ID=MMETSP1385-20130828/15572_1 /ASSEMBLY_ACC=CAM_ASM_000861 /TAXON_ID=933848 /ORGANISM="Elphidium margaritaceum" /LENGTH=295 /DNA_ID=CAMNT_0049360291 /DNA_START=44 /DNA_END=931 /DNA_ORIENTATION=-